MEIQYVTAIMEHRFDSHLAMQTYLQSVYAKDLGILLFMVQVYPVSGT